MLGPNGVGKSTIFNLITGLIQADYGSIIIDGKKLTTILSTREQQNSRLVMYLNMVVFFMILQ